MENGQQQGPVSEEEFEDSVQFGRIGPDTLVWNEELTGWKPYSAVHSTRPNAPPVIVPRHTCVECKRSFPADEVIHYQDSWICAACKPIFFQKVKEGAKLPGTILYGGFWIRVVAKIIDGLIDHRVSFPLPNIR